MSEHICKTEFVAGGEVVCFDCGAAYIYNGKYDAATLAECRDEIESRVSSSVRETA